ncbi:MAG: NAD(P)H-hydrate dehydratase [Gemmatimonadota bacterium]
MTVRVVTAEQAAARDTAAIGAGIPSLQLMRRAGLGAAERILERLAPQEGRRALVCCGVGNNGGDGWIVAGALARAGVHVHVLESGAPKGPDASAAREETIAQISLGTSGAHPHVVVDALLGTGAAGPLRGVIAELASTIADARARGALVVALDLPSGVDATTGAVADGAVIADLTISFGTIKRGQLLARSQCGEIAAIDIGLAQHANLDDGAPVLVDAPWVDARVPAIVADAHKGTRRRLLVVGGDRGMAGSVALAAHGAMRSGIGMVKLCVHQESVLAVQSVVPQATAIEWPIASPPPALLSWPNVVLIGPGLGPREQARATVTAWLTAWTGPVVVDADALNAFAGDDSALGDLLDGRPAIITPHPLEFARLIGVDLDTVLGEHFEIGARLARALHAVVLLKGVPTVVTAPDGTSMVSAAGTPVLASAGSGDILGGIAATLLAQGEDPFVAAASAAWIHGRAGELANAGRSVRGVTLDDVLLSLGHAWSIAPREAHAPLAHLPRVGDS